MMNEERSPEQTPVQPLSFWMSLLCLMAPGISLILYFVYKKKARQKADQIIRTGIVGACVAFAVQLMVACDRLMGTGLF